MSFDEFVSEILRNDMEHKEVDKKQMRIIWDRIVEGLSKESGEKSDSMKYP